MYEQAANRVLEALEVAAADHQADIVSVEVAGTSKAPVVRVRIDHADESLPPISLDEVSAHTAWISEVVEFLDPFPGAYTLEVSSPGLDRPLRRPHDFERFAGETVQILLGPGEGRRKYTGVLNGMTDGQVQVTCDNETYSIPFDDITSCKIKPTFDFSSPSGKK